MSFVHLHVHSQYSLLDGFSNLAKLTKRAHEMGMPAIALTDHGTMFGVIEFFKAAKSANIKPIIGIETYIASRKMTLREPGLDKESFHLILLAENMTGYLNLLKIASASQLEGFYYHPRIDHDYLAAHSEGLIASTACLGGEVPQALMAGRVDNAAKILDRYYEIFGPDRFFLELQSHDIPELVTVNKGLLDLGKRYNSRFIATNDVHYIEQSDARLQDIMLSIQTSSLLTDSKRFRMQGETYYLRSPQDMASLFPENPEALSNTILIAERCNVDLTPKGYHLPKFDVPEGYTVDSYLRMLCEEGAKTSYGDKADSTEVQQRLEYELEIIHNMGFDAYFLIVWDLCRFARENDIWYEARGSAAGSLVAYALDITLVEPLEQGLIFERFLNPSRVSMPDVDLDFQDDQRSRVMEYCANKYGNDRVAQIITFGTLGARAALRDVGRVMDIPLSEVDRVAKLIPNIGKALSITDALEQISELKSVYNETEYFRNLIDTASSMEGVVRNAGTHAAGVIISDIPLVNYAPLHRPTSGSEDSPIKTVVQFEMSIIEYLGLLKVDFLGLSTLTVMKRACDLINKRHGVCYNLKNIPLDDPETFQLLGAGHTAGVFQLEGNGMTRYLTQMRPQNLANIIAMVALYRPGPMENIPSYIKRMHGEEAVTFKHEALEEIFGETYGIPIYQEQLMFAAMELGGYSAAEADDLRKSISKKNADEFNKHRQKFIQGAQIKGINSDTANDIFNDWDKFALYGFNKSHAADYGTIAVETAFLKTHYTAEYMTALLSVSKNDTAKVATYVVDCHNLGIDVLQPDVNSSVWDFSIEDRPEAKPCIRFGLGAIKNVGLAPVDLILGARGDKLFKDMHDFARRVDLRQVGKRTLDSMIRAGALDVFGSRQAMLDSLDRIMSVSASHFRAIQTGQMSFFGAVEGIEEELILPTSTFIDSRQELEWEKELIGLYVSAHPLSPYQGILAKRITHVSGQLAEATQKERVIVAGIVSRFRNYQTKTGKPMGFVTLQDIQGDIEIVVFPKVWEKYSHLVTPDAVLLVSGRLDQENTEPKLLADVIEIIDLVDDIPSEKTDILMDPADDFQLPAGLDDEAPEFSVFPVAESPDLTIPKFEVREPSFQWNVTRANQESEPDMIVPQFQDIPPMDQEPELVGINGVAPLNNPTIQSGLDPRAIPQGKVIPGSFLISPVSLLNNSESNLDQSRMITIVMRTSTEKNRDVLRFKRVYGLLQSYPGKDRFAFMFFESGQNYQVEFPNDTTGISQELIQSLGQLVGEENVRIESLILH